MRPVDRLHPPAQGARSEPEDRPQGRRRLECRGRVRDRPGEETGLLNDPLDLLPQDRREQAERGLVAAFDRSPITALTAITTGASAQSYRVDVAGRPYLLRPESPRRDPHRAYACLPLPVEAGIPPA